jgi:hypothetical protein
MYVCTYTHVSTYGSLCMRICMQLLNHAPHMCPRAHHTHTHTHTQHLRHTWAVHLSMMVALATSPSSHAHISDGGFEPPGGFPPETLRVGNLRYLLSCNASCVICSFTCVMCHLLVYMCVICSYTCVMCHLLVYMCHLLVYVRHVSSARIHSYVFMHTYMCAPCV